jgi:NAD(P)-dependent dehydrogenase (short-subunit alcohol dehydrogenase family)
MHINQLFSLKEKIVLVSGGAGLYGKCILEGLAEAKATVITASRNLENCQTVAEKLKANNLDAHAMQFDQSDHESIVALRKNIQDKFGRLDVFVNNSVARPMKKYIDPLENFKKSMKINATGMFDITREMADLISKTAGKGSLVNIGSMQGCYGADFSLYEGTDMDSPPDYHFHKGGMVALTKYLARKLAPNIRVNCISPGGLFNNQDPQFLERYNKKVPLSRMANHDDIKGVVLFFATEASAYITGENILMDGGLHC